MIQVLDARFVSSAVAPEGYPGADRPEVAFVGRSNVGKSSMINALTGRRKLVRVSNTPGRTRTLNFFDVELRRDQSRYALRLADLPGYGYAKASKADRSIWHQMISTYLEKRQALRAVVSIVDAEVGPTGDDVQTLDYLVEKAPLILVVGTKLDRLPKAKRKPRLQEIASRLEVPEVLPFSATEKTGVEEVWAALLEAVFPEGAPASVS
ncbi:MAG: YihA family ribosome biogenesis GTP-binding protein [Myxococcales bacterium]|nr:YihA family ribosome biogenesis GTP-binding protein [Myxococcales bacterium]